ncbi:uncharacterized protein BXZ73DRAFT_72882 [Epithele typhae]|uniref:uncharacterized protein n=1 Tax=Epithele typhae TaxID=378194 RepID=UPI002007DFDB|nr:uncharacterized protein BXZ73DRAFT_72882 [Epithele typhae]KAH9946010.1 hypothetical protein BXZ73DRAFT_72882 [Epithele typhae]
MPISKLHRDIEELRAGNQSPRPRHLSRTQGKADGMRPRQACNCWTTTEPSQIRYVPVYSLESCLKHIFAKYCTPKPLSENMSEIPQGAYLTPEGLDAWARDTNGSPFDADTKEELLEFMDVTDDGGLTFKGFMQVYQLQTENDEEETWRDLLRDEKTWTPSLVLLPTLRHSES